MGDSFQDWVDSEYKRGVYAPKNPPKNDLTLNDIIAFLASEIEKSGNNKTWADQNNVSPQYVGDVLHRRREPGGKILEILGIEKVVIYKFKNKDNNERN